MNKTAPYIDRVNITFKRQPCLPGFHDKRYFSLPSGDSTWICKNCKTRGEITKKGKAKRI
jgi:hypothetical protein